MLSLKQRMEKQLLGPMYILSNDPSYHRVSGRNTCNADKIMFKMPSKTKPIYERSRYYIGSKSWNDIDKDVQKKENILVFKKEVASRYATYRKN